MTARFAPFKILKVKAGDWIQDSVNGGYEDVTTRTAVTNREPRTCEEFAELEKVGCKSSYECEAYTSGWSGYDSLIDQHVNEHQYDKAAFLVSVKKDELDAERAERIYDDAIGKAERMNANRHRLAMQSFFGGTTNTRVAANRAEIELKKIGCLAYMTVVIGFFLVPIILHLIHYCTPPLYKTIEGVTNFCF